MGSRMIVLAAALLAGGIGAAMAQSNAPTLNAAPTRTETPSGPGAATMSPSGAQNHDPAINPNAAGTQQQWRGYGATAGVAERGGGEGTEHSGSQREDANTHPLKAVEHSRRTHHRPRPDQSSLPPRH